MNEQQMRYFQKLAERQNLSRTAQELVISPPALSAVIRRLEEELDCRLFDRNGRGIVLNQNGQLLLRRVNNYVFSLFFQMFSALLFVCSSITLHPVLQCRNQSRFYMILI